MPDHSRYFERPIVIHRWLTELTGSLTAGAMLSQALYWSHRTHDQDGWFYKTQKDWEAEIGISRSEQEGARKKLQALGCWHEARRGLPAKLYFRVDRAALMTRLDALPNPWWWQEDQQNSAPLQNAENLQSRVRKTRTVDAAKSAIHCAQNPQSEINECARVGILDPEITSETTSIDPPLVPQGDAPPPAPKYSEAFERFWKAYPHKIRKAAAWKIWERSKLNPLVEVLLSDIQARLAGFQRWQDGYIQNPTTYLNGRMWEDGWQDAPQPLRATNGARNGTAAPRSPDAAARQKAQRNIDVAILNGLPIDPVWEETLRCSP